jgi:hypothetical protein
MNYIKTKLSSLDKEILNDIYEELENVNIPTTFSGKNIKGHYHAVKTGTTTQKNARQTCFGQVYYQGKYKKSKSTIKYRNIMPLFKEFIKSHYPTFKFKSVYVNKNTMCKEHIDNKNIGESLLVGLGPYTGGKTVLYINNKQKKFHIKTNSLIFNGFKIPHKSEPFKGIRYSLVFFN